MNKRISFTYHLLNLRLLIHINKHKYTHTPRHTFLGIWLAFYILKSFFLFLERKTKNMSIPADFIPRTSFIYFARDVKTVLRRFVSVFEQIPKLYFMKFQEWKEEIYIHNFYYTVSNNCLYLLFERYNNTELDRKAIRMTFTEWDSSKYCFTNIFWPKRILFYYSILWLSCTNTFVGSLFINWMVCNKRRL